MHKNNVLLYIPNTNESLGNYTIYKVGPHRKDEWPAYFIIPEQLKKKALMNKYSTQPTEPFVEINSKAQSTISLYTIAYVATNLVVSAKCRD